MDYTVGQIQKKLETLSQLVNDHAPHEAGVVTYHGEDLNSGDYIFKISYKNDKDGLGIKDIHKFLSYLKDEDLIQGGIPPITHHSNFKKTLGRNVSLKIDNENATIIFYFDNTNEHFLVVPALDNAIKAAERRAQDNRTVRTTGKEVENRPLVTTPPDPIIEEKLKELVALANYIPSAGNGRLSYQNQAFNIIFPKNNDGFRDMQKMFKYLGVENNLNDKMLDIGVQREYKTIQKFPTSRAEFHIDRNTDTINIVFTPNSKENNIAFLDHAIENAARFKNNIFRESKAPRSRDIYLTHQAVCDHLLKKTLETTDIPEKNISVNYAPGNLEMEVKPSFTITITENKLTPEKLEKLKLTLISVFLTEPQIIQDKRKGEYYISLNGTPKDLMSHINKSNNADKSSNNKTARTR